MIKVHFNGCGARGGNDKIGKTKGGNNMLAIEAILKLAKRCRLK